MIAGRAQRRRCHRSAVVLTVAVTTGLFGVSAGSHAQTGRGRLGLGTPATPEQVAALDTDVRPDGTGLPAGKGTAADGAAVYALQCAACHGAKGEGGVADVLVGGEPRGMLPFGPAYEQWRGTRPDVEFTIGNYWPYATTLFDYVRRAMPAGSPGSLTPDQTYAVVAWLLAQNGVIEPSAEMNAQTLPKVAMPAHGRFVPDARRGGREVR